MMAQCSAAVMGGWIFEGDGWLDLATILLLVFIGGLADDPSNIQHAIDDGTMADTLLQPKSYQRTGYFF